MATELYDGTQDLDDYVVRFTAEWCGPCKVYAPLFDRAAAKQGETWLVVDVDQHVEAAAEYGVMGIPAVFDHGERVTNYLDWTRERA